MPGQLHTEGDLWRSAKADNGKRHAERCAAGRARAATGFALKEICRDVSRLDSHHSTLLSSTAEGAAPTARLVIGSRPEKEPGGGGDGCLCRAE